MPPKKPNGTPNPEGRRVTVRDIAKEVGLHFTTVAEALRGSSRIKESTRERVFEAADRLGYRPDPVLSALSAYRSSQLRSSFQGVMAWINGFPERDLFTSEKSFYADCYSGSLERATSLGYNLEMFWVGGSQMTGKRISQILQSRNIVGVIVGPMPAMLDEFHLEWEHFNSVRIGYSLKDSRITTVISDQYQNTRGIVEKLLKDGFRRIGFACPRYLDSRVSNKFSGGYLSMIYNHFNEPPVPLYLDREPDGDPPKFLKWYNKYKPEVIVAGGRSIYYKMLADAGIRVPEEVQFVALHAEYLSSPVAGISQNGKVVGATAVDHLISMIQGFKIGLESFPKTTMIPGRWVDGGSYDPALLKQKADSILQ
ncbi:MAG: LacI family DNA-binding transcriptional regulator [Puniceicoccaceae bacterium]